MFFVKNFVGEMQSLRIYMVFLIFSKDNINIYVKIPPNTSKMTPSTPRDASQIVINNPKTSPDISPQKKHWIYYLFIDPNVNLYEEKESINNKSWIIPLNDEIKGL